MKLLQHLIIFMTIFAGFWADELISEFNIREYISLADNIPYLIETCFGLLIFCFGNAVGFHMLFFVSISYIIHVYVFRFRIFSYLQLIIFFASTSIFYLACKYLLFFPINYSYLLLIFSFFVNAVAWLPIYFGMRLFRRRFF